MQRKSLCEPSDASVSKMPSTLQPSEGHGMTSFRKPSLAPSSGRTLSISSQSRPSLVGVLTSKRFAKHLSLKAMRKRSSVFVQKKEPTYRMVPEKKFLPTKVEECIRETLETRLRGFQYTPKSCARMCEMIGDDIKFQVKAMNFDRYKIVCSVLIGQLKDQGAHVGSRCAWDENLDNFATYSYKNDQIFCTAAVFGVYSE